MKLASPRYATFQVGLLITLALGAFGLACSSSDAQTPAEGPGYTECGDVTCSPGQHCAQPTVSICEEGCLTDENCPAGQVCDPDGLNFRKCIGSTKPPPTMDSLAACKAACDHFQTCGLAAADTAQCRTDCEGLTNDQRAVIANCGDDACSTVPQCLGVECLSDKDCANGLTCVGSTCL
ncbi:hypothetical protein [Polyangium fumosum]|uniref:hypothetical protein n=1 Tax=Polyangium fumosum TaxID=889272 RepID=UPI001B87D681|nr:hypothetical protein [Polyangium fumosum]